MALRINQVQPLTVYQVQAHAPDVLADMEVLRRARAAPYLWLGRIPVIMLGVVALYLGAFFFLAIPERILFGLLAFVLLCVLLVLRFHLYFERSWNARELDELARRQELVTLLLQRFQVDLMPTAFLDLRFHPKPRFSDPGRVLLEARQKGTPWDEHDPWLTLEARLADGARLTVSLVERLRKRQRITKRWDGVIIRTKTRVKHVTFLSVQLRVKPKHHPDLATLTESRALRALRLPPDARLRRLRLRADRLRLQVRLDGEQNDLSRTVTMMVLSLYQLLHVARSPPEPEPKPEPKQGPKPKGKRRGRRAV